MKRILLIAVLTWLAHWLGAQITTNTNFKINSNNPIDNRMTIAELGDTSTINFPYEGLLIHVNDADTYYKYNGSTWEQFDPGGGGFGDVTGPGSSTDNAIARFDGIGNTIQNSSVTVDDSGNIATTGTVDGRDVSADGATLDALITVDTVATYTEFRSLNSSKELVFVRNTGIRGLFMRTTGTTDDGGIYIQDAGGTDWVRVGVNDVIYSEWYGAIGDNSTDCTTEIQAALDYAGTIGGGTVVLPPDTVLVSNDSSAHANTMLLIPDRVNLRGYGRDATILTRASSKRGNNGIFISPMGYDTAHDYNAAGNFTISDFTITDGAITPNRALGDLIALAHAENVIIERMGFGNHDQHSVDIHGSNNITIRNCVARNYVTASSACATFQVENAVSGGVWGSNADTTYSKNIYIHNNDVVNTGAANTFHIFHGGSTIRQEFENINIYDNVISGSYEANEDVIGTDDNMYTVADGLKIRNNTITVNNSEARGINFYGRNASGLLQNVDISGNNISGNGRAGIALGGDFAGVIQTKNILISSNSIDLDAGSSTSEGRYGLVLWGSENARITSNYAKITGDTIPTFSGIYKFLSVKKIIFSHNIAAHNYNNNRDDMGVVYIGDPESTGVSIMGFNNYLPQQSDGVAIFENVFYKATNIGNDSYVNINPPLDPVSITPATLTHINLNNSESGIFTLDFSSYANQAQFRFYNPRPGGEYKLYITGCASDSLAFESNVLSYVGDSLGGRLCTSSEIIDLYYDGTNYVSRDTFWTGYSATIQGDSLLDLYSDEVAAYSLRPLYHSWVDSTLITVRRSSDNAELDFTGAEILDGTLTTWTGANDGFVKTVRDQSGGGYDVTQTTTANQPQIVSSGSLITKNGKPALRFDGTNDLLQVTANPFSASSAASGFSVFAFTDSLGAAREVVWGVQDNTGNVYDFLITRQADDNRIEFYVEGDFENNASGTVNDGTQQKLYSVFYEDNSLRSSYTNSTLDYSYSNDNLGTLTDGTDILIGGQLGGSNYFKGEFQELIIFNSNQISNRTGVESNINDYY